jgi:hypothetical protein
LEEAILKNVEACKQLAQITRTSMGPKGMRFPLSRRVPAAATLAARAFLAMHVTLTRCRRCECVLRLRCLKWPLLPLFQFARLGGVRGCCRAWSRCPPRALLSVRPVRRCRDGVVRVSRERGPRACRTHVLAR